MPRRLSLLATSVCLAVMATVAGTGSVASAAGSQTAARSTSVPAGFHIQSLSWISPKHGWMLGSAPCGSATCTTVAGTTDGGGTWNVLGTLAPPLTQFEDVRGLSEIRFADDLHGWAFGPALWATNDGGSKWRKQSLPGGGRYVVAFSTNAEAAYLVVSSCRFGGDPSRCTNPLTLWRTDPDDGTWTQVPLTLPVAQGAILAQHEEVAYLVVQIGELVPDTLDATVDGVHWSSRPDPCDKSQDEFLASIVAYSDTEVAMLCQANIGFGKAAKRAVRSDDTAQTTTSAGKLPLYGIQTELAATPNGTLSAASYSIGSWIYRNAGARTWTTPIDLGDGGQGWNDIVFTTNKIGWVVHGPAVCCGGNGPGQLGETTDGGLTWNPVS